MRHFIQSSDEAAGIGTVKFDVHHIQPAEIALGSRDQSWCQLYANNAREMAT